jgi:hypothetical protein
VGGKKSNEMPRVLMIDEVDVFFSKEFYNRVYVPIAQIRHQKISYLLDHIWDIQGKISFSSLKRTA